MNRIWPTLAIALLGAVVAGFSLGTHTPWVYDMGWVGGVWFGGWITAIGVSMTLRRIRSIAQDRE
jgi:hypothetical protein